MMRKSIKNSLNIILAASLLMSCSASNDVPDTLADGSHAVKLDMRVGVSAGVVTGSRELDTWDGAQQVNDMRIYVFRCPEDKKGTPEEAYTYCTIKIAKSPTIFDEGVTFTMSPTISLTFLYISLTSLNL